MTEVSASILWHQDPLHISLQVFIGEEKLLLFFAGGGES